MKRQVAWNKLKEQMSGKRTRTEAARKKGSSAPHEIIVQRLAAEADNKQTYKPVQPREFVDFDFDDLSLGNLKKACADHFNLPASTCDVLVSNKGPSCTSIAQIPHRKDKVYFVRFVVMQHEDSKYQEEMSVEPKGDGLSAPALRQQHNKPKGSGTVETIYPASISVAALLKAGKLVKPKQKNKVTLIFEKFDVTSQKWIEMEGKEVIVDTQKFSSGAFRDAFHATTNQGTKHQNWVLKTYNDHALETIEKTDTLVQDHCRKQVQMHAVARHLAKSFTSKAPPEFGECFKYNCCFYTTYNGQPATVEEYVPGSFYKFINNDGQCVQPADDSSAHFKELYAKAQCLVHYTYASTKNKLMLLDIQGSDYTLYDPEIATTDLTDEETDELYFCCGNCATVGIENFLKSHICNNFCQIMNLFDEST